MQKKPSKDRAHKAHSHRKSKRHSTQRSHSHRSSHAVNPPPNAVIGGAEGGIPVLDASDKVCLFE
jgi:hypothetical protein